MQPLPKLSVVLPVYNGALYLKSNLDSLFSQSFSEYEVLICDDHSTDGSKAIIQSYVDKHNNIRFWQNSHNKGLFPTLNFLFSQAHATWVRIWSQDDIMLPQCLETEYAFISKQLEINPLLGMVYCRVNHIDENDKITYFNRNDNTPMVIKPKLAAQLFFYHGSLPGNIANVGIRKDVWAKVGGFDESMRIAGDFDLWERISNTYDIGFINQHLMYLRNHSNQLSRQKNSVVYEFNEADKIFRRLAERLPVTLQPYAKKYAQGKRHRYFVRVLLSNILRRNYSVSYRLFLFLVKNNMFWSGVWEFMLAVMLRKPEPRPVFDNLDG
ncbi:MAG TPA: glycosyltransferase [Anaerolineales bacterium]|nr:glycosyltransferase [Anaerolineales bacterium]